MSKLEEY